MNRNTGPWNTSNIFHEFFKTASLKTRGFFQDLKRKILAYYCQQTLEFLCSEMYFSLCVLGKVLFDSLDDFHLDVALL